MWSLHNGYIMIICVVSNQLIRNSLHVALIMNMCIRMHMTLCMLPSAAWLSPLDGSCVIAIPISQTECKIYRVKEIEFLQVYCCSRRRIVQTITTLNLILFLDYSTSDFMKVQLWRLVETFQPWYKPMGDLLICF